MQLSALVLALALFAPPAQSQERSTISATREGWSGGIRTGTLLGQVEEASELAPQFGGFLRHSIYPELTGEVSGSYGRIRGNTYSTDMTLGDVRLLYLPTTGRYMPRTGQYMTPYVYAGVGAMRFNLDRIPLNRTVDTPGIGWAIMAPVGLGVEVPLLTNVAFDLNAGYTYSFADDLDAVRTGSKKDAFWHMSIGIVFRDVRGLRTRSPSTPPMMTSPTAADAEQVRQRIVIQARYDALRDSLAAALPPSSAEALRTMSEMIHFGNNGSELSAEAKSLLRDKVVIFEANPAMRIVITGYSSQPGTSGYNMALGLRRAEAAKAYLVSQGVDPIRVEIATHGEGRLVIDGKGALADAANRRAQFRLQVADPFLVKPVD